MPVILRRNPVDLLSWHLVDQFAMTQALTDLRAYGWTGAPVPVGDDSWRLELNKLDDSTLPLYADIGDWLVLDMGLRKLTAEECADNYTETES